MKGHQTGSVQMLKPALIVITMLTAASGARADGISKDTVVCDTVAQFALADGRMHNHNDAPVAGCHDVLARSVTIVETDIPGGSYAIVAKVRYGSHVGYSDQAFIQIVRQQRVGR